MAQKTQKTIRDRVRAQLDPTRVGRPITFWSSWLSCWWVYGLVGIGVGMAFLLGTSPKNKDGSILLIGWHLTDFIWLVILAGWACWTLFWLYAESYHNTQIVRDIVYMGVSLAAVVPMGIIALAMTLALSSTLVLWLCLALGTVVTLGVVPGGLYLVQRPPQLSRKERKQQKFAQLEQEALE